MLERVDKLLLANGLAASRAQAQKLIEAKAVQVKINNGWQLILKHSQKLPQDTEFKVDACDELRYVSRAGLKLEAAIEVLCKKKMLQYPMSGSLKNTVVLDIGQSTGGFTDCLLKHGAELVVGVDVGHEQLVKPLKTDQRVVCLEGVNARNLPIERLKNFAPDGFDIAVMDVSFISQTKILPNLPIHLKPDAILISLVKPQFEVGKSGVGKGGLVKPQFRGTDALKDVVLCAKESGFIIHCLSESPILGGDGNTEYLMIGKYLKTD